jgi:HlyD family secretion protein
MSSAASESSTEAVKRTIGVSSRLSRYRSIVVVAILVLLGVGAAWVVSRGLRAREAASAPAFETAVAQTRDITVTVRATGTLEARTTVDVGAEVSGRVLTVKVDANDPVKKGQLLAELDPEQLRAAADQTSAQVVAAEASIAQAKATVTETALAAERAERLYSQGLAAKNELESSQAAKARAEANLASAKANALLARAALTQNLSRLDKARILSPIDGSVLSRLVEPGATVTAGFQTPLLFRLAQDLTQMRLKVDVDEADMGRVREGMEATFTVEAYPEKTFTSRVLSVRNEPKTSQSVVTYQAVLEVDNRERLLRPGMTCTATIASEVKRGVLAVPNAALRFVPPTAAKIGLPMTGKSQVDTERGTRVFRLSGNTPVAVKVRSGVTDGIFTEIVSEEAKAGTTVIVDVKEQP